MPSSFLSIKWSVLWNYSCSSRFSVTHFTRSSYNTWDVISASRVQWNSHHPFQAVQFKMTAAGLFVCSVVVFWLSQPGHPNFRMTSTHLWIPGSLSWTCARSAFWWAAPLPLNLSVFHITGHSRQLKPWFCLCCVRHSFHCAHHLPCSSLEYRVLLLPWLWLEEEGNRHYQRGYNGPGLTQEATTCPMNICFSHT